MNNIETPASAREFIARRHRAMDSRRSWALLKRVAAFIRKLAQ